MGIPVNPVIIVSYYDQPEWLCNNILDRSPLPVIVADDGSHEPRYLHRGYPPDHIRLADRGFRKATALNEAIYLAANKKYDYAIFLDQDAIFPFGMRHWVEEHIKSAYTDCYVASRAIRLTTSESNMPLARLVEYLKDKNRWAPSSSDFSGNGSGCWIADALAVGGFDESFGYIGEDINFGERLRKYGIQPQVFNCNELYTLNHSRPWNVSKEMRDAALLRARNV